MLNAVKEPMPTNLDAPMSPIDGDGLVKLMGNILELSSVSPVKQLFHIVMKVALIALQSQNIVSTPCPQSVEQSLFVLPLHQW